LRQTEDHLLNPGWVQRLSEICVTDNLPEKIELVAADFVGVVGRLDQCLDCERKARSAGITYRRKPAIAIGMFIRSGSFSPG
jgi:hypothetical protein